MDANISSRQCRQASVVRKKRIRWWHLVDLRIREFASKHPGTVHGVFEACARSITSLSKKVVSVALATSGHLISVGGD